MLIELRPKWWLTKHFAGFYNDFVDKLTLIRLTGGFDKKKQLKSFFERWNAIWVFDKKILNNVQFNKKNINNFSKQQIIELLNWAIYKTWYRIINFKRYLTIKLDLFENKIKFFTLENFTIRISKSRFSGDQNQGFKTGSKPWFF